MSCEEVLDSAKLLNAEYNHVKTKLKSFEKDCDEILRSVDLPETERDFTQAETFYKDVFLTFKPNPKDEAHLEQVESLAAQAIQSYAVVSKGLESRQRSTDCWSMAIGVRLGEIKFQQSHKLCTLLLATEPDRSQTIEASVHGLSKRAKGYWDHVIYFAGYQYYGGKWPELAKRNLALLSLQEAYLVHGD